MSGRFVSGPDGAEWEPNDPYSEHLEELAETLRAGGFDASRAAELDAAVDILTDDGMPMERAMNLMVAALKKPDPLEPQARHIVKLRRGLRTGQ